MISKVLLGTCYGVLGSFYGVVDASFVVSMVFWVVTRVLLKLLGCSGWFLGSY